MYLFGWALFRCVDYRKIVYVQRTRTRRQTHTHIRTHTLTQVHTHKHTHTHTHTHTQARPLWQGRGRQKRKEVLQSTCTHATFRCSDPSTTLMVTYSSFPNSAASMFTLSSVCASFVRERGRKREIERQGERDGESVCVRKRECVIVCGRVCVCL